MTDSNQDHVPGPENTDSDHTTAEGNSAVTSGQNAGAETSAAAENTAPAEAPAAVTADTAATENLAAATPMQPAPSAAPHATAPLAEPTATQPQAGQHDGTTAGVVPPAFQKRSSRVTLVAALAAAALIGGVVGGGISAIAVSSNQNNSSSATNSPVAQNITVNDTKSVNVVTAVAAKVEPSVVTISVTGNSEAGTGSGVILSADGYVLTNTHVVTLDGETASGKVQVTTSDGHIYDATIVGTDPVVDLAVIKLKDASGLQPASFANSSKLNVGETAIAIGAPLGLSNTVTDGIVSSLNRSITIASSAVPDSSSSDSSDGNDNGQGGSSPFDFWQFNNGQGETQQQPTAATATISLPVIQTDAAINPGNSGGALLNSDGKVIGINVAIASAGSGATGGSQAGSIGVGFAIPSNLAERVANEIIKTGKATHGLLGAGVADATSTAGSTTGALIKSVTAGGAAAGAGIKEGDVITEFNGVKITGATDLTAQVRFLAAGASTSLTYVRDGKSSTVDVTLGTLK